MITALVIAALIAALVHEIIANIRLRHELAEALAEAESASKIGADALFDAWVVQDAIKMLRQAAEDETSYEVEIAGRLQTYILPLLQRSSTERSGQSDRDETIDLNEVIHQLDEEDQP